MGPEIENGKILRTRRPSESGWCVPMNPEPLQCLRSEIPGFFFAVGCVTVYRFFGCEGIVRAVHVARTERDRAGRAKNVAVAPRALHALRRVDSAFLLQR